MKHYILLPLVMFIPLNGTFGCSADYECDYPSKCIRYQGSSDGVCAGGYDEPRRNNNTTDIYGNAAPGLIKFFGKLFKKDDDD